MNTYEYEYIIDKWTNRYNLEINPLHRPALIESYQQLITLPEYSNLSFDSFTKQLVRKRYYDKKYPFLDLLEAAYSIPSQN